MTDECTITNFAGTTYEFRPSFASFHHELYLYGGEGSVRTREVFHCLSADLARSRMPAEYERCRLEGTETSSHVGSEAQTLRSSDSHIHLVLHIADTDGALQKE